MAELHPGARNQGIDGYESYEDRHNRHLVTYLLESSPRLSTVQTARRVWHPPKTVTENGRIRNTLTASTT